MADILVKRPAAANRKLGVNSAAEPTRKYTFSVVEEDPQSPKTPMLPNGFGKNAGSSFDENRGDPVVSVPAMIDNSVITIQNRMERVSTAMRKDPDMLDKDDHPMEFDMMNSVYKTVQNVAYHINKINRSMNPREEKWPRPVDGEDGLDILSGLRGAMVKCQQGGTKMNSLVKERKKMLNTTSTSQVLGENALVLHKIEGAMLYALTKSGKALDAIDAAGRRRQGALLAFAAAAFFQVQTDQGDTKTMLLLYFRGWVDALTTIKEEKAQAEDDAQEKADLQTETSNIHQGGSIAEEGESDAA